MVVEGGQPLVAIRWLKYDYVQYFRQVVRFKYSGYVTWLFVSKTTIMSRSEFLFPNELTDEPKGSTSTLAKSPARQSSICWQAKNRIRAEIELSSVTEWNSTICSSN